MPPATVLVRCLDADRRVGTADRDRDTSACRQPVSMAVSSPSGHTVKVRVTTWVAAIGAGAVQVVSFYRRVTITEGPRLGGNGGPHAGKAFASRHYRDVASSTTTVPPETLRLWSAVYDADRRAAKDRDRDTSAGGGRRRCRSQSR